MRKFYMFGMLFCCCVQLFADEAKKMDGTKKQEIFQNYLALPLSFTQNNGQWKNSPSVGNIHFQTHAAGAQVFFGEKGVCFSFSREKKNKRAGKNGGGSISERRQAVNETMSYGLRFLGANNNSVITGKGEQQTKTNYILGKDPVKHYAGITNYDVIEYKNLYNNIDVKYYGMGTKLKYDAIVRPGGNIGEVQIKYNHIKGISINKNGQVEVRTAWGVLKEERPYAYQIIDGEKKEVSVRYTLKNENLSASLSKRENIENGNVVGFKVEGEYDRTQDLIIDPYTLLWSTFVGGTGISQGSLFGCTVDAEGNVYATGQIDDNFPTTGGAYQKNNKGGHDIFVFKLNAAGNALLYSTFIGGSGDDVAYDIAINNNGEVFITGETRSQDFPVSDNAFQKTLKGGRDAFVVKLNQNGSALEYSTYLGGSSLTELGNGIAIDGQGDAFVTGITGSNDFPVTHGSYDTTYNGSAPDVFVTKLNPTGSRLIYSTFIGGTDIEGARKIIVNTGGEAFITGNTASANYPVTSNAFQRTKVAGKNNAAFITKLNSNGDSILYSTFIGGSGTQGGGDIAVSFSENGETVYVVGSTTSTDFPVSPNALQKTYGGDLLDAYLIGINIITGEYYSTYLGGSGGEYGYGVTVSSKGDVYVSGYTNSINFPVTSDAIQPTNAGAFDFFISKFSSQDHTLEYSTYLGGESDEIIGGRAFLNSSDEITLGGISRSETFPTTAGAFQKNKLNGTNRQPVIVRLLKSTSAVGDKPLPQEISLGQNYPNPFFRSTTIPLSGADDLHRNASLRITDIFGREVYKSIIPIGSSSIALDLRNLSDGVYYYSLSTAPTAMRMMIVAH